jgi:multidrug efflux system membrane fusion protein
MDADLTRERGSASAPPPVLPGSPPELASETRRPDRLPPQSPAPSPEPQRASRHGWVWFVLVLLLLGVGGYFWYAHHQTKQHATTTSGHAAARRSIPVVASVATAGDLPIYLTGLGTVTPLNTVTVRSRVDGQITKISFREGQNVQAGDALVEIDPRPFEVQLAQAKGQYARDQALLKNAQLDLKRYRSAQAAVTQQQIDTQSALVQQYQGLLQSDQAQIDNAQLQISYCHITAPISGRTGLRLVDVGNMVHAGDATGLVVITELHPITVIFTIPQDQIARVQQHMNSGGGKQGGALPVEAYNRDLTTRLASGVLSAIDNQVDPSTGTVRLKATFPNDDGMLFPNQFVNARLLVETLRGAVLIPAAAVQRGPDGGTFVYVVKSDNTVTVRPITLGPSEATTVAVSQGLRVGESVVTQGVDKLQEGTKVAPHASRAATQPASRSSKPASRSSK